METNDIYIKLKAYADFDAGKHKQHYNNMCQCLINMYDNFNAKYSDDISRAFPAFTGHGIKHVDQILKLYEKLLEKYFANAVMGNDIPRINQIYNELFILASSAIWHDIGMAKGKRDGHAKWVRSDQAIRDAIKATLSSLALDEIYEDRMVDLIGLVAAAHSDEESWLACEPKTLIELPNIDFEVSTSAIAGILRLCDELSDNSTRVTSNFLKRVVPESKIYWLHSSSVVSTRIDHDKNCIKIAYEIPYKGSKVKYPVSTGTKVNLINYILYRIDKVHAEMNVCCPLFHDFAEINRLEVTVNYKKDDNDKEFLGKTIMTVDEPMLPMSPISKPNFHKQYKDYKSYRFGNWNV